MRLAAITACLALTGLAGAARAAVSYTYFVKPGTPSVQYDDPSGNGTAVLFHNVAPGQAVPLEVWLRETVTGSSASRIDADAGGLFGVGVAVWQTNNPASPSKVVAEGDIAGNLAIAPDPGVYLDPPLVVNVIAGDTGYVGVDKGGGVMEVFIGTFTFTAGNGGTTDFKADRSDPASSDTMAFSDMATLTTLDDLIASSAFSIAVVPEPATLSLIAGAGLLLLARSRRGSRR